MQRKTKQFYAVLGFGLAWFLFSRVVSSTPVFAYTASITTNDSIVLDASPAGNGVSSVEESINVVSDCRNGYNLTIATPEGSSLYKYDSGTQAGTASFTAVDGTSAISSSNNTNKWGYTISNAPDANTVFLPLSSTASVLKTSSQTASPSANINDTFNISYGIKVDDTITPGSYQMANQGAIVYYLTMDTTCTQYTVAFNANGGSLKSGVTPAQGIPEGEPTKLTYASDIFTAPSTGSYTDAGNNTITGDSDKLWTFWGWNEEIDGTGDWYKDREAVTDLTTPGSSITLYAQWKQATLADLTAAPASQPNDPKTIDHNLMQDMSPETCWNSTAYSTDTSSPANQPYDASTNTGGYHTITLLDYRGKVTTGNNPESPEQYTVSKLADSNCWMTTNLNLGRASGGPNGDGTITLTSEDTDLADNATFTLPVSTTTSNTTSTAATIRTTNTDGNNTNGTYYSWAAAVANTTSVSTNPTTTSICPKYWDLPASSQYTNLSSKSGYSSSNQTTAAPSSFLINGGFTDGATFYQTSYSYYWTNTSYNGSRAYGARVNGTSMTTSSSTGTIYGGNKYYRQNLRCVASLGKVTINYDGNGSDDGSTDSQVNVEINSTNLRSNGFTRTHYSFKNWNTEAGGTGTTIANSAALSSLNLKPGDTITLYAQWTPQRQIIYNDNCSYNSAGCATNTDTTNTSNWTNAGSNITLGSDTYFNTKSGYAITSWNTARDGSGTSYNISSSYTVPSSLSVSDQVTLYAMWTPALTINFNSNGGTGTMTAQLIPENTSKALKSNSFTAPSGQYFAGWMTEESRTTNTVVYANGATYTTPTTVTPGDSITLYAKWGPRYTIIYNGNNATGGSMVSSGTELKHTNINEGNTVNLYAPNYYKTNYGFAGWSPSSTATIGSSDPIYGPNETISAPAYDKYGAEIDGTKTVTLYAVWIAADSSKTMQTFDHLDCQAMPQATYNSTTGAITAPTGSVIALKDQRDNNVYTVARLADGNCWMIENLRLEAANTVGNNQTNPSITNQSLAQGYGGVFTGLDSTENSNFSENTNATPNNMYNSTNITGSYPNSRFPRYNNNNTNTSFTASYNGTGSGTYYSWYSYGNYYTWAAAMANTTYYGSATGTSGSESAGTSLCPTHWTLPLGSNQNQSGSFYYLNRQMGQSTSAQGSKEWRAFPNNFLYSGYFNGPYADYRGSQGHYWSRSANSNNASYDLYLNSSSSLNPLDTYRKSYGFSVRCLIDYTYVIQYDGNNATGGSMVSNGAELKYTGLLGGETINLYPSNYYKTGYGFAGWSIDPDAWTHFTDNDNTNNPIIYGPMETITAPAYPSGGKLTLYAVWAPADTNETMQTFDYLDCQTMPQVTYNSTTGAITAPTGSVIALRDQRDNNVYTVARLADGNCWMTENLRLDAANTVGNNQTDPSVTNESLSEGYGGVFTGLDSAENSHFSNTTAATPNNLYNSTIITGSYKGYRFPRYNNNNTNTNLTASYNGKGGDNVFYSWYSYGNYYTWAAVMANTTDYSSAVNSEVAGTSICPASWTLPTSGNSTKDFGYFSQQYGGTGGNQQSSAATIISRFRTFPNNLLYSGTFEGSSDNSRGSSGFYWSKSSYNDYRSFYLVFDATSLYTFANGTTGFSKYSGASVRCIIDKTYTIQYDGNNATGGSMVSNGAELKHTGLLGGETINLYPSNYYKTGYGFAGWSTDPDAWTHFTDNDNTNNPIIYGPMETITAPAYPSGGKLTLYAVWVPAKKDGSNNPVYLQDFNATSCGNLTSTTFDSTTGAITVNKNSIVALTDKRDNNVYTVAKLADGNCWMTENLRLDAANTVGNNQYDSSITNESLSQGYGGVFTGLDSTENSNFTNSTNATPNNLYNSTNITGSYPDFRFPRYNNNNTNTTLTASYDGTGSSTYYSWYSYGNYYTWAAAMANTIYYGSATGASGSDSAGTSICPTNWALPTTGTTMKDFGNLSQQYGGSGGNETGTGSGSEMSNRFRSFPNNFIYSGKFSGISASNRGSTGYYWSRSASYDNFDLNYSDYLDLSYISLGAFHEDNKSNGLSVRCLVDN